MTSLERIRRVFPKQAEGTSSSGFDVGSSLRRLFEDPARFEMALQEMVQGQPNDYERIAVLQKIGEALKLAAQDQRERKTGLYKRVDGYKVIVFGEVGKMREKLQQEIFPEPIEPLNSTISVIEKEGNTSWKLRVLRSIRVLDELCKHPKRHSPTHPARGVLYFDQLPDSTTIELAEYVQKKITVVNEKERVAGIIDGLLSEVAYIVESETMLGKVKNKEDKTFILTLFEAIDEAQTIADITRPPLNERTLDRLIRIISEVDDFSDLNTCKTIQQPLEPVTAQILTADYLRHKVLPNLKTRQMKELQRAIQYSDAYYLYVVPAGEGSPLAEERIRKLQEASLRLISQDYFRSRDYIDFTHRAHQAVGILPSSVKQILAIHKKKIEIDEQRRQEAVEQARDEKEESVEKGRSSSKRLADGVPELTLITTRRVKDVLSSPRGIGEELIARSIQASISKAREKVGEQFFSDYKIDELTPHELTQLLDIILAPASAEAVEQVMDRVLAIDRAVQYYPQLASGIPIQDIKQVIEVFTKGTAAAKQTILIGDMGKRIAAAVIRFEGLQFENRRYRNVNLPEPFEKLSMPYLQTEIFLHYVVDKMHEPEEIRTTVENIDRFLAFDKMVVAEKKITAAIKKDIGLNYVLAKLKDLRQAYERRKHLTYKQRRFVVSLCREYQRKISTVL